MNLFKSKLLLGIIALIVPTPGFADESELIRSVVVFTGNSVDTPGTIRGAKAVGADGWATPADFPADIPDEELRVSAGVNLTLDSQGKVLSCESDYVGASKLEHRTLTDWIAATCGIILRKGSFAHAIDGAGRPVPSAYRMTAVFEIKKPGQRPYMAPPAPAPPSAFYQRRAKPKKELALKLRDPAITNATPRTLLDIDAKGRVVRCRIRVSTGSDASDAAVCSYLTKQKFAPAIGRDGVVTEERYLVVDLPVSGP
jgi:hypothetical protein